jgi:hypothetical protein
MDTFLALNYWADSINGGLLVSSTFVTCGAANVSIEGEEKHFYTKIYFVRFVFHLPNWVKLSEAKGHKNFNETKLSLIFLLSITSGIIGKD